jgi:hypothetical protein
MLSSTDHWLAIGDRWREAEILFRETSERKIALREMDTLLIAQSMRRIKESRELLYKLDKSIPL